MLSFMGDDTWTSLYPGHFHRSFPFPSFNTRDLHTVDDGILSHLRAELARPEWTVFVAHFLGVDHVGHTFGPASQAMEDKLEQMDAALREIFSVVGEDTLVLVMGDHGMTEDGNHGGATQEETGAALVVWSRKENAIAGTKAAGVTATGGDRSVASGGNVGIENGARGEVGSKVQSRKVAQIDLVPTLSLLLGNPIPYGSLGGVITDLFLGPYDSGVVHGASDGAEPEDGVNADSGISSELGDAWFVNELWSLEHLSDALLVNSVQVWRYLHEYSLVATIPEGDLLDLHLLLSKARLIHKEHRLLYGHAVHPGIPTSKMGKHFFATRVEDVEAAASSLGLVCAAYKEFLDSSIGLGRRMWTQYDPVLMGTGVGVLAALVITLSLRVVSCGARSDDVVGGSSKGCVVGRVGNQVVCWWLGGGLIGLAASLVTKLGDPEGVQSELVVAAAATGSCLGLAWSYLQFIRHKRGLVEHEGLLRGGEQGEGSWMGSGRNIGGAVGNEECGTRTAVGSVAPPLLAALYCGGLFSNSFIEGEDSLHQFLGVSTALALAAVVAAVRASCGGRHFLSVRSGSDAYTTPSPYSRTALYAALATAACLRAAASFPVSPMAGVETGRGNGGVGDGSFFAATALSLGPLPILWLVCSRSRCHLNFGSDRPAESAPWKRIGGLQCVWKSDSLHKVLQAVCFAATASYWLLESSVGPGAASKGPVGQSEGMQATTGAGVEATEVGLAEALSWPVLRLLLPRLVYLCSAMGIAISILSLAWPTVVFDQGPKKKPQGRSRYFSAFATTAATGVATHLIPIVVILLGPTSPPALMFMVTAGTAICKSLKGLGMGFIATRPVVIGVRAAVTTAVLVWAIGGRAFFFLTGHHNQFSRLQYSSAFIGFDEFNFQIGGLLLFINTFGTEILAVLGLPLLAAAAVEAESGARFTPPTCRANKTRLGDVCLLKEDESTPDDVVSALSERHLMPCSQGEVNVPSTVSGTGTKVGGVEGPVRLRAGVLTGADEVSTTLAGVVKTATGLVDEEASIFLGVLDRLTGMLTLLSTLRTLLSSINVSVQRGHLMLWAVFAPKFVFDATMQVVCGIAIVAMWTLVTVAYRGWCSSRVSAVATVNLSGKGR
ncbi:unnamed protein product [Choristocarpus tenellus]